MCESKCLNLSSLTLFSVAGVTVGDPVLRTGKPLSVELGPGKAEFLVAFNSTVSKVCTLG